MLPSWFTKLRNVKTESKQSKQPKKQHGLPPTTSKKRQDAPTTLVKSFSLRRASSKARSGRIDSEVIDACTNEYTIRSSVISNESDLCKGTPIVCDSPPYPLLKEAAGALLTQDCTIQLGRCQPRGESQGEVDVKNAYLWDYDVQSIASSKDDVTSKLLPVDEGQMSTLKGNVVSDTDTEEFAPMSETSSTFGSEMSSADSSLSSKCSTCEESHQEKQIWQQGLRSSECMHINVKKNCDGSLVTKVLTKDVQKDSGEIQQSPILYELHSKKQCTHPIGINSVGDGRTFPNDANKSSPNSIETRMRSASTRNSSSSIESNENDSSFRLVGDEDCALLDNYANGGEMTDRRMAFVFDGKATANFTSKSNGDKHQACNFDDLSLSVEKGSLQKDRETARSSVGSMGMPTGGTPCGPQVSMATTIQMQRRRQRGSSISAVLPPDLQGVVGDSLAFVKISDDPYEDFRQSMYEMIMEKDLEGSMDVEELLYCYLTLNSPEHHELIEEVFSDVWSAVLMTMR